jgi:phosphohistidine phosphatase
MKTLLLLRHAKAGQDDPALKDIDRPLNDRGENDARLIGKFIAGKKIRPDLVISSPAKRALQTVGLVLKAAGLKLQPTFDERIYENSAPRLLEVLSEIEEPAITAMLVGHNPGCEELFHALTGDASDLPTASLACVELQVPKWSGARPGSGNFKWLVTPKELRHE